MYRQTYIRLFENVEIIVATAATCKAVKRCPADRLKRTIFDSTLPGIKSTYPDEA